MRDALDRLRSRLDTAEELLADARRDLDDDDGSDTPYLCAEVDLWVRHRDRLAAGLAALTTTTQEK